MAGCSGRRLWLITGLGLALLVAPATASAQVRNDDEFYSLLTAQSVAAPPAPAKVVQRPRRQTPAVAEPIPDTKDDAASLLTLAKPEVQTTSVPVPTDRQPTLVTALHSLSPITLAMIVAAILASCLILWIGTPLPCLVCGHRRSSKSVRFSEDEKRWVGHCKSCGKRLARRDGVWKLAEPTWRRPEVLQRTPADHPSTPFRLVVAVGPEPMDGAEIERIEWPLPDKKQPQSNGERLPLERRAQAIVSSLMDDIDPGAVPTPGTRGALFSVVDELRARCAKDEWTLCAEKISIRMQELERALQRGDDDEASLARGDLKSLAGKWMDARVPAIAEAE